MSFQHRNAERAKAINSGTPVWEQRWGAERGPCFRNTQGGAFTTLGALEAYCEVNNREIDYAKAYGEPGYSDPVTGILFANWNDIPRSLQSRLEVQGYELEWSDEWYIDHNSGGKAYRTSPDSYGWQSQLLPTDGDYLTPDDGIEAWIEECQNDERRALPSFWDDSDIAALGWTKGADVFERGFHPGQTDEPAEIVAKLKGGQDFLFQIADVGQFDVRFHVWTKPQDRSV